MDRVIGLRKGEVGLEEAVSVRGYVEHRSAEEGGIQKRGALDVFNDP